MKIILLKDVKGIGRRYDEKNVSDGYANNFLIPKQFAVSASAASAAQVKSLKEGEENRRVKESEKIQETISKVAGNTIEIQVPADEKNHLFQKLNAEKVGKLVGLDPEYIVLENPIKETGTYSVPLKTTDGKQTSFTLLVARS